MNFNAFIITSFVLFILSIALAIFRIKYKKEKFFTPFRILFIGTLLSGLFLFYPVYYENFKTGNYTFWISAFSSLQHTFRLFAIDGEYLGYLDLVKEFITDTEMLFKYTFMCTILYFVAPILTFTFFILMLKNFIALVAYRCVLHCKKTHVFSELNDKSVALAKSIIENDIGKSRLKRFSKLFRTQVIVFTDVVSDKEEKNADLIDEAKKLGAIIFYKDIESLHIAFKKSKRKINIYLISENENVKLKQAEYIMKNYDLSGIELYVFSESTQSQMILRDKNVKNIKVVRVNDIRTLIYHNLDKFGMRLFDKAFLRYNPKQNDDDNKEQENNTAGNMRQETDKANNEQKEKTYNRSTISAVIIGFGRYGKEMLKALSWFCQYPNFDLRIDVFDSDKTAKDYFEFHFPGMAERSGNHVEGEDNYTIKFHPEINVNSPMFRDEFNSIENPTYIFVCLGTDEDNINAALNIRKLCNKRNLSIKDVDIETVVYDSNSARLISAIWNEDNTPAIMYGTRKEAELAEKAAKRNDDNSDTKDTCKNTPASKEDNNTYGIHITGDLQSFYSFDTVIDPKWEKAGMLVNRRYEAQRARVARFKHEKPEVLTEKEIEESNLSADKNFWQKEYNYRSSVSKAIHEKLKLKLHQFTDYGIIMDELKAPPTAIEDWKDERIFEYSKLEHPRWCAYMRSEGYVKRPYDNGPRDEVTKTHTDLIPVEELKKRNEEKLFYDL